MFRRSIMGRPPKGSPPRLPKEKKVRAAKNGPRYSGLLPAGKSEEGKKFTYIPKCEKYEPFIPGSELLVWDQLRYAIRFPNPVNFVWALRAVKEFLGCTYTDMAHNCGVHRFTLRQWLVEGRWPPLECNRTLILESFLWCLDPDVEYVLEDSDEVQSIISEGVANFADRAREMLMGEKKDE